MRRPRPASRAARRRWIRRQRGWAALRNYLLAGFLVTAPLIATLWLVSRFLAFVDRRIEPLIPEPWNPETYLRFGVPGLGLLVAVVVLVLVGFFTTSFTGRVLTRTTDKLLSRVPVVRSVYGWTKQLFETLLAHRSAAFREVVLVPYPQPGVWAIGFVTGRTAVEVQQHLGAEILSIFVPAAPNVTTGFLLFLRPDEVRPLHLSVEEGLKMVLSGGVLTPSRSGAGAPDLATETEPPHDAAVGGGTGARLRHCFFTGLLVTGPIGVTLWLIWGLASFVDARVALLLPEEWRMAAGLPFAVPGAGVLLVLLGLILVGMFATGFVGRALIRTGEGVVARTPVVSSIYGAFKHFFGTVFNRQAGSFREVVLLEYPRPGSWALGFLTGRTPDQEVDGRPVGSLHVYLPTTPNPTSGFLLLMPPEKVRTLRMSVEEGFKIVVSGGLVLPAEDPDRTPNPLRRVG